MGHLSTTLAGLLIPHIICTPFVLARGWLRSVILRKWVSDDQPIVAAWLASTVSCVVYSIASKKKSLDLFESRWLESRLTMATVVGVIMFGVPLLAVSILQCEDGLKCLELVKQDQADHLMTEKRPRETI